MISDNSRAADAHAEIAPTDVAIIGMAASLPEADDLGQFLHNLRTGRDSVRELSQDRKRRTSLPPDEHYQLCGYIEEIDLFDHAFFGYSKGEADNMSPHHRLLLQAAVQAVDNAGYPLSTMRGRRGSVYMADTRIGYDLLAARREATMVMGSHVAATAGRLSRFLGLTGPSAMVDTSCSSGLVAVHFAVNDLVGGDADIALAGAASLNLFADRLDDTSTDIGIRSRDGKARSFAAESDGTGSGEAVVVVVLKRLADAVHDGDNIHAVLKSVAVNNVGGRSSTLTAPDVEAEAEVLERAWRKAGIDPATIGYLEAHGTATRLGDPIEVEAIDSAFGRSTDRKRFCALSSVKTNIGHTWSASGLVGIVKATLALRSGELFPNVHSAQLNPLIDFDNSAVVVTRDLTPWPPAGHPRRAGISSFGVMGTNAHAVLEQAPERARSAAPRQGRLWVPISAASPASLMANIDALCRWIDERPDLRLDDLSHTLVAGRDHHRYRYSVVAGDVGELRAALALPPESVAAQLKTAQVGVILSDRCLASAELVVTLRAQHPVFDERYRECEHTSLAAGIELDTGFAFQYAIVGLFRSIGLPIRHIVPDGAGKHVAAADSGRVTLEAALRDTSLHRNGAAPDPASLSNRVDRLLDQIAGEHIVFVEAGPQAAVSAEIVAHTTPGITVLDVADRPDGYIRLLADLYRRGIDWEWSPSAPAGQRIELPPYQFQQIRCWIDDTGQPDDWPGLVEPQELVSPSRTVEEAVHESWRQVLGLETVDPDESFFDIGGDSISGLQVLNRLREEFAIALDQFVIFDHETPRMLAEHVRAVQAAAVTAVCVKPTAPEQDEFFPLSPGQQQIWVAAQFQGGSVAFNLTRGLLLDGPVDPEAMRQAVSGVLERHAGLRATFVHTDGQPRQRVGRVPAVVPLEIGTDHRELPGPEDLRKLCRRIAERRFDLTEGPLFRVNLMRFAGDRSILVLSTHHLVADGWSLGILVGDLMSLYHSATALSVPLPPAGDYRGLLLDDLDRAGRDRETARQYWLDHFAEIPPPVRLPVGSGRTQAFRGTYRTFRLADDLWIALKHFTRLESTTTFAAAFAVFAAYFARHTESGEVTLGTSLAGRNRQDAENAVGMFVRTVPVRTKVDDDATLRSVHTAVRAALRDAARHDGFRYEELVGELRRRGSLSAPHLFDVLIEFQQFSATAPVQPDTGLVVAPLPVTLETSVFPINIMLSENTDGLDAVIRYDTGLFDAEAIEQLWTGYCNLLEVLAAAPGTIVTELPLIGPTAEHELLNIGYQKLDFDPAHRIHHAIERIAAETPERACLGGPLGHRTFGELNGNANGIARLLSAHGIRPGDVVAILMDRSPRTVEAILGIWKIGAAYLPIDPKNPVAYVASVLDVSRAALVLSEGASSAPDTGVTVVDLDVALAPGDPGNPPRSDAAASELAYVIYTSGSTGTPKGAMVEHTGMLNHLHAKITDLQLSRHSVVAQTASNSFDISVWQMFAAPYVGGRTVIYPQDLQLEPGALRSRLESDAVTVLEVVPSYLDTVLHTWVGEPFAALNWLMVTGEVVQPKLVNEWLRAFPRIPVINAYGPTEASDDVTHHIITEPVTTSSVPLGRPIVNTAIYVLDERSRVLPRGEAGEICVSGVAVGRGYLHDPEQTSLVFVPDPFHRDRRMYRTGDVGRWRADGTLELIGRRDTLVKIRGFRVDLGAIEHRVGTAPGVRAAAVVTAGADQDRLVAYVVLDDPAASTARCAAYLAAQLPEYMRPDLVELDRLPLTPNGKTDRKALERHAVSGSAPIPSRPPTSLVELTLTEIWEEVLGCRVGIDDRFLDTGGNSLLAIQVVSRIRHRLDAEVTIEQIFTHQSIASLATVIGSDRTGMGGSVESLGGPGEYPVAPIQRLMLETEASAPAPEAFNRNDLFEVAGEIDTDRFRDTFAALLDRYESLRTTYPVTGEYARMVIHPAGELELPFAVRDLNDNDAVHAYAAERIQVPFDISREPLIRIDLLRTTTGSCWILMSMHQLASDGRTVEIVLNNLLETYRALQTGIPIPPAPVTQYKEFAAARRAREDDERLRGFWHRELESTDTVLDLRTDRPRPPSTTLPGGRCHRTLDAESTARFDELATVNTVTGFVVARTAVALLLFGETDRPSVTIGAYARGRDQLEWEDQIGCCLNIVPMRLTRPEHDDLDKALREAQGDTLRAFAHQDYPYGSIMRDLRWRRGPDRSPLFDVMIAYDLWDSQPAPQARPFDLVAHPLPRRAKEADLQFTFGRTHDTLEIVVTYNTDLYTDETAAALADRLCAVIDGMLDRRQIAEIGVAATADRILR
ncbi:amino acid adenylation domain-containing protein [Nocardia sp. NPDC005745]|uniref:amino acid adenylation domain-containing protein n=1 Tax=Nocardia sp. NPDC005745 TaxID=3157061 RepID=UPI00340EA298